MKLLKSLFPLKPKPKFGRITRTRADQRQRPPRRPRARQRDANTETRKGSQKYWGGS